jgi:hypothetical protein
MQHKKILEDFEIEMWQYLDNSLTGERRKYWLQLINSNMELQQMLEEAKETFEKYNEFDTVDIDKLKFNRMIDIATSKESLIKRVKNILFPSENNYTPKLAFGTILIIASIVVLFISKSPNPINKITIPVFSWNDESMGSRFAGIRSEISLLENENLSKCYFFIQTKDEWDREIYSLNKKIDKLLNESNEYEL